MFGNDSQPSRIYAYAAKRPTQELERVREQMLLAHRYRNRLVELELQRRAAAEEVLARVAGHLEPLAVCAGDLQTQLETRENELKAQNAVSRNQAAAKAAKEELRQLRRELKAARRDLKLARAEAWQQDDVKEELKSIEERFGNLARQYRAESGLYWGSYLHVEQSCSKFKKGPPPRFRRFDGRGHLAVQIQKGMTWGEALAMRDNRLRILIVPPPRGPVAPTPGSKRRQRRLHVHVHFRVGSDQGKPVFAVIPAVLHRPLPEEVAIKWVHLLRRRVGPDDTWEVQFVVSRAAGFAHEDNAAGGHVGVDLGWRLTDKGLRVAAWVGSDGQKGEILIPSADLGRWRKAEGLQSQRDENFNSARAMLGNWLIDQEEIPDWLRDDTEYLDQWRSPGRLTRLVWEWRESRFAGDEEIYQNLEAWRKHERHLHRYQAGVLRQAQAFREHLYLNAVANLRRRYQTAHLEKIDWRELARKAAVGEDRAAQPYQRRLAAPGRLAQMLHEHMSMTREWPAEYTTQRCCKCGRREMFDSAAELVHTCGHCQESWDQDFNSADILLQYAQGDMEPLR